MIRLLTGDNEFALHEEQRRSISAYLTENDPLGLERVDGQEVDVARLRDAVMQLPFLVSKKLVVLSSPFAVKAVAELLTELLPLIPEEIDVLLVDPKADKRTKLYKELFKMKAVEEFSALKGSALEKWAVVYARDCGTEMAESDARYLVDRVGADQMLIAREIEKLSYATKIEHADIDELTDQTLQASVFDLLDRTFTGKQAESIELYEQLLANKSDPNEILSLIAWQLHIITLVKYAGQGAPADIAKRAGIHPFVAGKALNMARRMSTEKIKESVARALSIDTRIKTSATDPSDAVKVLLLELSNA